jgi:hypothetical protein
MDTSTDTVVVSQEKKKRKDREKVTKPAPSKFQKKVREAKSSSKKKNFKLQDFTGGTELNKLLADFLAEEKGEKKAPKKEDKESYALTADKNSGEVSLPKNLEQLAADPFIQNVLKVTHRLDIKVVPSPGIYKTQPKRDDDPFWQGFFAEMISLQKVSSITYSKESPFINGRSAARYEILKACVSSTNQPFIKNIPEDIKGTKKTPGILYRMISVRYEARDIKDVLAFLHGMVGIVATYSDYGFGKYEFRSFLPSFADLMHACKHTRKRVVGKGKRAVTQAIAINPTKPSQVKTVTPYERDAVKELYETPWHLILEARKRYDSAMSFADIDRSKLMKFLKDTINSQWANKQLVLSLTKSRTVFKDEAGRPLDRKASISATQKKLASVKDKTSYGEFCKWEKSVKVFPSGPYKDEKENTFTSFTAYVKTSAGQERYPKCYSLLETFEEFHTSDSFAKSKITEESKSKDIMGINPYAALSSKDSS